MRRTVIQRAIRYLFFVFAGLVLYLSFQIDVRHDYAAYYDQWTVIIKGQDPWILPDGSPTGNAYGPLFNLLSIPFAIHPGLPKALFTITWLSVGAYLYRQIDLDGPGYWSQSLFLILFIFLNPFFLLSFVYYGQFDVLVAALCLASVLSRVKARDGWSGFFLGLAFLLKLYPLVILPALALQGWQVRWRLLFAFIATVAPTLLVAYLIWGGSIFEPLSFGSGRESTAFSIFFFLRGIYSPIGYVRSLDWASLPLMVASLLFLLSLHIKKRFDPLVSAILFLYVAFVFYKVGHSQFYTSLFFLLPYWFFTDRLLSPGHLVLKTISVLPLVYLSAGVLLYFATSEFAGGWARMLHLIGLPAFILTMLAIAWVLTYILRSSGVLPDLTGVSGKKGSQAGDKDTAVYRVGRY